MEEAVVHQLCPATAAISVYTPSPPIQVWMPNQAQAIRARSMAGTLAPRSPNDARAKTGYGMPYLVPAWLFSSIGSSTTTLATAIVMTACTQFRPEERGP